MTFLSSREITVHAVRRQLVTTFFLSFSFLYITNKHGLKCQMSNVHGFLCGLGEVETKEFF